MTVALVPLVARAAPALQTVLVQGLDGDLYTRSGCISPFVEALSKMIPRSAFSGLYYAHGLRDYAGGRGTDVNVAAASLRTILQERAGPTVLIGHCLGALICTEALLGISKNVHVCAILIDALSDHPASDTSDWARGLLDVLGLDVAALRNHGKRWRALVSPRPPDWLEVHAVLSTPQSWVTPFVPANGVLTAHQHPMPLDHQALVATNPGQPALVPQKIAQILRSDAQVSC
jgi:hypothetical protein